MVLIEVSGPKFQNRIALLQWNRASSVCAKYEGHWICVAICQFAPGLENILEIT